MRVVKVKAMAMEEERERLPARRERDGAGWGECMAGRR